MADQPPAPPPKLRVLAAYPYLKDNFIKALGAASSRVELLMDSGAFTAWQSGKAIALDDYCRFIDGLPLRPWRYFTLDVIGDHVASRRNYEVMLARGYKPVPIFTRGTPYAELADYGRTSDVVGVGGLAGKQGNRYAYLKAMVPHAKGQNLHLLGITSPDWVKYFRPYSCDSSTWLGAGRYGWVNLYMGRGLWENFRPRQSDRPSGAIAQRIARYGLDPYTLGRADKAWRRINEMSWVEFSLEAFAMLGTRLFLATGSAGDVAGLLEAQERVLAIRAGTKAVVPA